MCVLGAAPFAALGFIRYHGMSAEKFLWAWIRSELLEPKRLTSTRTTSMYYDMMKDAINKRIETEPIRKMNEEETEDVENTEGDARAEA